MDEPPGSAAVSSEEERLLFAVRSATAQIDPIGPGRLFPSAPPAAAQARAAPPRERAAQPANDPRKAARHASPPAAIERARSRRNLLLKLLGLALAAGLLQYGGAYFEQTTEQSDEAARLVAMQRRSAPAAQDAAPARSESAAPLDNTPTAILEPAPVAAIRPAQTVEPAPRAAVVPVAAATRSPGAFAADVIAAAATLPREGNAASGSLLDTPARCDRALAALALCTLDRPAQPGGTP